MVRLGRFLFFIFLVLGVLAIWQRETVELYARRIIAKGPLATLPAITTEVLTPGPLRDAAVRRGGQLTRSGILRETNRQRTLNNATPLSGNALLDQAAQKKVEDMFSKQYFEHISPSGVGPAELADSVGYRYIRVGENLALGNFEHDAALVQAWMDSPGHRANLLHSGFSEIGIAARQGTFEGRPTWLAVQSFGLPASICTAPDPKLQTSFDATKQKLDALDAQLQQTKAALDMPRKTVEELGKTLEKITREGNDLVAAGNKQIEKGNEVHQETGNRAEAEPYWQEGERLQREGRALLEQARQLQITYTTERSQYVALQDTYNQRVTEYQVQAKTIASLQEQLNKQIQTYNTCLESH